MPSNGLSPKPMEVPRLIFLFQLAYALQPCRRFASWKHRKCIQRIG